MFWKKKVRCPISEEDKIIIEDSMLFLQEEFGCSLIKTHPVILPTKHYFDYPFKGSREDAYYILNFVRHQMDVNSGLDINVIFYVERPPIEYLEGVVSVHDEGTELTTGKYIQNDENHIEIMIEEQQLKDTVSLVATISHEIAHYKLLGEGRLEKNDEILTDLTTTIFGFGLFTANSSLTKMQTWYGLTHTGWQVKGGSGYLHYKHHGFILALYSNYRDEINPSWINYLEKDILKEYQKSARYFDENPDQVRFKPKDET